MPFAAVEDAVEEVDEEMEVLAGGRGGSCDGSGARARRPMAVPASILRFASMSFLVYFNNSLASSGPRCSVGMGARTVDF